MTMRQYLSDVSGTVARVRPLRESGVNIGGSWYGENSFPSDCKVCYAAGMSPYSLQFGLVVAHEIIGHNSLDQSRADAYSSDLYERKHTILQQSAGTDVVFTNNRFNHVATETHFRNTGLWSGSSLEEALANYYAERPELEKNNLRSRAGMAFFLLAPQEYFASLSNQYYTDSELMLRWALERAEAGHLTCLDQFLLVVTYLSQGSSTVNFFRIGWPYIGIERSDVEVHRNTDGHIVSLRAADHTWVFSWTVDKDGFVTAVESANCNRKDGRWTASKCIRRCHGKICHKACAKRCADGCLCNAQPPEATCNQKDGKWTAMKCAKFCHQTPCHDKCKKRCTSACSCNANRRLMPVLLV